MTVTSPGPDLPVLTGLRSASVSPVDLSPARLAPKPVTDWKRAYHRRVFAVDAVIVVTALLIAELVQLVYGNGGWNSDSRWDQLVVLAVLVPVWLLALELQQSRDISLSGNGIDEYARVVTATLAVIGLAAAAGLLLQLELSRMFLAVALALGLVGLFTGRHLLRKQLARQRISGRYLTRVLVLGRPDAVQMLCERITRAVDSGYRVVGACVPQSGGDHPEILTSAGAVPVVGDDLTIDSALQVTEANAVVVAAVGHLGHENMKKLAWKLESRGIGLIVVPGVTDIAGPRLLMRPIDNLPLLHIASPRQEGPSGVAKRTFDLIFGALALLVAAPVMALAALAIKLDDRGPVIFRQERVGLHGRTFRIFKFRTMTTDAEARKHAELQATAQQGIFFKSACDSRVTRVGKFLRATSVDELPQLLNVLGGSMSVVGPRPLVPGEGASVEDFVARRGLVKPGITGLWQISGRSDLSEDERIRLDHSYIDSWSCVRDLAIVWRTLRAVLARDGAY